MEPPKIVSDADPAEGRGCWMGCFGIGCLVIAIGFVGLLVGGWYTAMHTSLPLVLIEQAMEQDGKVKIEGISGSISKGIHIDALKFLTVDDEHWSELRGVKFDYNGFIDMSRNGRFILERMSVDSGKVYVEGFGADNFSFNPGDFDKIDELKDSDITEIRIDLLEVKDFKIIDLDSDYTLEIDEASLKDFVANGKDGIKDLGELTIKSNMMEASTEACDRWPGSSQSKRVRGVVQTKISDQLKKEIDFTFDFDFQPGSPQQGMTLFQSAWAQVFSKTERSIELRDFSPTDYFAARQILPSHISLVASRAVEQKSMADSNANDEKNKDTDDIKLAWDIQPGASFKLGKTTFQIQSAEGNRAPLRSIVGTATVNGDAMTASLHPRDYFLGGQIELKVGEIPADSKDWAQVVFGADFETLSREDQRLLEATIVASKVESKSDKKKSPGENDENPKAEAENSSELNDKRGPEAPPAIEKIPTIAPVPVADDQ